MANAVQETKPANINTNPEKAILLYRTCEALVLAFDPEQPLFYTGSYSIYIPPENIIESSVGFALGRICGSNGPTYHSQRRPLILWRNFNKPFAIKKRVFEATQDVTFAVENRRPLETFLDKDCQSLERHPMGDRCFYRFKGGERGKALENAKKFWGDDWDDFEKLHEHMRPYAQSEFAGKKI